MDAIVIRQIKFMPDNILNLFHATDHADYLQMSLMAVHQDIFSSHERARVAQQADRRTIQLIGRPHPL